MLLATAVVFGAALLLMHHSQQRQMGSLMVERAAEANIAFGRVLESRARTPRLHADDYTRWDEFVEFIRTHDAEWGELNITGGIPTFGLDVAWVLDDRFRPVFTGVPGGDSALRSLPVPIDVLARSLAAHPVSHFFASTPRGIIEVWTSSIVPSVDLQRQTPPRGYYIIGYVWSAERMAELSTFAGGEARLTTATGQPDGGRGFPRTGQIEVRRALRGIDGTPLAAVLFTSDYVVGHQVDAALRASSLIALLGAALSLLALWLAMTHWVGRPLRAITRAMEQEDATHLAAIRPRRDELGQVAELVGDFFVQRDKLIEARKAAEAAALAKSNFLANISHELRTPMHGILSFSRFGLRDGASATREELRDHFRQINACGESLLTLLNSLLDLAKLEAGRMTFSFSDVSMQDVTDVAMDEFRSFYHERAIELAVEVAPDLPPVVADRMRMLQVVRNLVSNAAKFTPAGGTVVVRVVPEGSRQRVLVEDSGAGIPPGEEELIFHKFTQASHTSPRTGGTGLGLAICREIVEAHEGRIWAENREGGGARVIFEVPVEGPAAAHEPQTRREPNKVVEMGAATVAPAPSRSANDRWRKAA